MNSSRQFIHKPITFFAFIATLFNPISSVIQSAYAKVKRILVPKGTPMTDLIKEDPAKVDRFAIEEIRANKVFLAYQVNGQDLSKKHGFPLRAVAEDLYGSSWTKYVHTVEADIVK